MIRVLVADDQAMVRAGFRMLLDAQDDIEVVAEATTGREAVTTARHVRPDVCLVDVRMPDLDGIEATRQLAGPDVADPLAVVVVTTFDLDEYVYGALRAGATGFLLKNAAPELLVEAVRAAADGHALVAPEITTRLLASMTGPELGAAPPQPIEPLTDREEGVLLAVARGLTNREIAREQHVAVSTIKTHVANLMGKIGARNRVELVIWAYDTGRRSS